MANKKLLQSYEAQPVIATKLCSTGDLNDFKETERFRLTDVGDLLPIAPDGEIKDGRSDRRRGQRTNLKPMVKSSALLEK